MDAPRGSVELEEAEELERLRRRAYGRDADIAGDAAAQARLSELEAAQRRQSTPVADATARVPAPVPGRVPVPEPVEESRSASASVPQPIDGAFAEQEPAGGSVTGRDSAEGPIGNSDPVDGARAASWWRRRRGWMILGGAIAALIVIVAQAAWLSQLLADASTPIPADTSTEKVPPVPDGFGRGSYLPSRDFVLALESVGADASLPDDPHRIVDALGISADELKRYEDFRGLNVWSGESRYGMTCLLVAVPGQGPREGLSADGCSPEGMDTIAELVHSGSGSTGAVFDGLPRGGLIRLLLRGDHVDVYLYEKTVDPNASQG